MPIYGHPKDPYKRIDILPSTRTITARVDGMTIAESSNNQFLHETSLRTRYYMPKTAVREAFQSFRIYSSCNVQLQAHWEYLSESQTTSLCPYKGVANCE